MSVIVFIVAMMAALVWPNLVTQRESRQERMFLERLQDVASRARETAIERETAILLRLDQTAGAFILAEAENADGRDPAEIAQIPLIEGIDVQNAELDGRSVGAADWELQFFPDGTAEPGAVQMSNGVANFSLVIDRTGSSRLMQGDIPDRSADTWDAGDYEHRQ